MEGRQEQAGAKQEHQKQWTRPEYSAIYERSALFSYLNWCRTGRTAILDKRSISDEPNSVSTAQKIKGASIVGAFLKMLA